MVAVRDPAKRVQKYTRPDTWKADLAHRNEVRWPKALAYAELPPRWSALDLRLWVFLVSHLDTNKMWGEHSLHIRDIKKWSGATKSQILDSVIRLEEDRIKINTDAGLFVRVVRRDGTFSVLQRIRLDGQHLCWTFTGDMITAAADMEDGYGRLHVEAIRRLRTFASLRLYAFGCFAEHSHAKYQKLTWEPAELVRFLGGKPQKTNNNLRRFVGGTLAELKRVGVFYLWSKAKYHQLESRGRLISMISFTWDAAARAASWGAEIDAAAKQAEEARLELERNPPPLTESQIHQQKLAAEDLRRRKRENWEWQKERAVLEWEARESRRREGEIYHEVMGS